jgi:hypothetical protein
VAGNVTGFQNGFLIASGLTINRSGEAFIGHMTKSFLYKYVDLNGNGDALDAGEEILFADLPGDGSTSDIDQDYYLFGLSIADGETLLANVRVFEIGPAVLPTPWGTEGIYWLADRDGDGNALGADEMTQYSPSFVTNPGDPGCIAAPRLTILPADPVLIGQFKRDGATPIAPGGATNQFGFVVKAEVNAPGARSLRLQVEVKPVDVDFTGNASDIVTSPPVASGTTAAVSIGGLAANTPYHWRMRAVDEIYSAWISFGTNPDLVSEVDLSTGAELAPVTTPPAQFAASDGAVIAVGERVFGNELRIEAALTDGNDDDARLEIEVRPVGRAFSNAPTASSPLVPGGQTVALTVALPSGGYHWQYRGVDSKGTAAAWRSFGANLETAADFELITFGSSNANGCVSSSAPRGATLPAVLGAVALAVLYSWRSLLR